jgi:hypothetical protein
MFSRELLNCQKFEKRRRNSQISTIGLRMLEHPSVVSTSYFLYAKFGKIFWWNNWHFDYIKKSKRKKLTLVHCKVNLA